MTDFQRNLLTLAGAGLVGYLVLRHVLSGLPTAGEAAERSSDLAKFTPIGGIVRLFEFLQSPAVPGGDSEDIGERATTTFSDVAAGTVAAGRRKKRRDG